MKMKALLSVFAIATIFLIFLSIPCIWAQEFPLPVDKYVDDFAGIFNSSQVNDLRNILTATEQTTTAEVVVASIIDCGGDYDGYAVGLASYWKIGKSDKDNGLLILYCLNEKKLVVKTGYGLEGILPDSKVGRLLDENYVPLRDMNKTTEGIIAFTNEIANVLNENKEEIISGQRGNNQDNSWIFVFLVFLIFFVIPVILRRIFRKKIENRRKSKQKPKGIWDALFWIWIANSFGRSSGSSGGGFGGGSFGGGGFGGGGASR